MLRQFVNDQFALQEPVALGMGVSHGVTMAIERGDCFCHDRQDFIRQRTLLWVKDLQIRAIACSFRSSLPSQAISGDRGDFPLELPCHFG
jgi:hypothetical protein